MLNIRMRASRAGQHLPGTERLSAATAAPDIARAPWPARSTIHHLPATPAVINERA